MIKSSPFLQEAYIIFKIAPFYLVVLAIAVLLQAGVAKAEATIDFSLQPNICVITKTETQCDEKIIAQWRSHNLESIDLCLYQQGQTEAIKCWQQLSLGEIELQRVIKQTTEFVLKDSNQHIRAKQLYEVIIERPQFQRPRRNPWSFY